MILCNYSSSVLCPGAVNSQEHVHGKDLNESSIAKLHSTPFNTSTLTYLLQHSLMKVKYILGCLILVRGYNSKKKIFDCSILPLHRTYNLPKPIPTTTPPILVTLLPLSLSSVMPYSTYPTNSTTYLPHGLIKTSYLPRIPYFLLLNYFIILLTFFTLSYFRLPIPYYCAVYEVMPHH